MSEVMNMKFMGDVMPPDKLERTHSALSTSSKDEGVASTGELDEDEALSYPEGNGDTVKNSSYDGLATLPSDQRVDDDEGRGSLHDGTANDLSSEDSGVAMTSQGEATNQQTFVDSTQSGGERSTDRLLPDSKSDTNRVLDDPPRSNSPSNKFSETNPQTGEVINSPKKRGWRRKRGAAVGDARSRKSRLRTKLHEQNDIRHRRTTPVSNKTNKSSTKVKVRRAPRQKALTDSVAVTASNGAVSAVSDTEMTSADVFPLMEPIERPVAPRRAGHMEDPTHQSRSTDRRDSKAEVYVPHEDKLYIYTYSSAPKALNKRRYVRKYHGPTLGISRNSRALRTTNFNKDNIPKWNPYFAYARSLSRSNMQMYETEEVKVRRSEFRRKMQERAKLRRENLGISSLYPSKGGAVIIKGSTLQPKLKGEEAIVFALATNIIREAALEIAMEAETDRAKMLHLANAQEVYANNKDDSQVDEERAEPEGEESAQEEEVGTTDNKGSSAKSHNLRVTEPSANEITEDGTTEQEEEEGGNSAESGNEYSEDDDHNEENEDDKSEAGQDVPDDEGQDVPDDEGQDVPDDEGQDDGDQNVSDNAGKSSKERKSGSKTPESEIW